ncbi:Serine/threonine-protein kinase ATG1 [Podospora aff. communis PSN243]|uniref:non-specific serine/threonine protein kinase n=1 Tax=Podospora aff. communis PSN243 TaxID=3040156 RepID=A0AAV9H933_9PEZI|nr:Serine/threonine-protein kinase ATG1 [Podospora aff. communis PSN243]
MADRPSSSRRAKAGDDAIGQFIIDQEIGKGSFAQVYSGRHKVTGALVAIKSVELGRLNKKLKENLYGEIKILKTLRHPHIVALHDCVESATHINLIMEYCELGDLSLFIKKRERLITNPATHDIARKYPIIPNSGLNEVVTRHFLKQLASALKFLREGNFVHRDVKPQNLLLLPSPQWREVNKMAKQILSASHDSLTPAAGLPSLPMLKLADFGFARVLPSTSLAETLCGSPLYMAPEILRYERYDAKADLWSVGTVLYEMVTGKPPFRAGNHVELLRKIEAAEDSIKFTRESVVSSDMKHLIRALLKRNPVERITFEGFFNHPVVTGPIPGLVEDDIPKAERREPRPSVKTDEPSLSRGPSFKRYHGDQDGSREPGVPPSPRPRRSSPLATPIETKSNPMEQVQVTNPTRLSYSPRQENAEGLGIRRPTVQPSTSAPVRPASYVAQRRRYSNAGVKPAIQETTSQNTASSRDRASKPITEEDRVAQAAQDVAFERDYVVVDKKHLEVNALADQISMYPQQPQSPRAGQVIRRATQQGHPTSVTGAVPTPSSRNMQVTQGRGDTYRPNSYEKALSSSPGSATSVISKAIQDASLRLFGFKYAPHVLGKGQSPPHIYNPFPTYPTPAAPVGLISDGKPGAPVDEDSRVYQCIEDYALRSDVVYGFAEVKYKQLVPLAPSMDHGLGGVPAEKLASDDEEGLTTEAIVALSEEALVLYVKALSLLAKSMDIASLWWSRKTRSESSTAVNSAARDAANSQALAVRINSVVQWIRSRFNEVLEKAEIVRLKLIEAQKQLPEDHPSHPNSHPEAISTISSSAEGVFLSSGVNAEKLMYDRALDMSRAAAINEIANEDLPGCEISYVTAIRMLEAVIDQDDDHLPKRRLSTASKDDKVAFGDEISGEMNSDDQQSVQKLIQMANSRLTTVRKKMQMIARASKAQQQSQPQQQSMRRRSGEITSRSVPAS